MSKIEIQPNDPHYDVVSWSRQATDEKAMAEAHYRNAVITGNQEYKLAFFNSYHRAKQIEQAISDYFAA